MANLFKTEDLAAKLAEIEGTPKTKAKEHIDNVLEALKALIADETKDGVNVYGLGTFEVKHKEAGTARNPKTGETVEVAEHDFVKFKISPKFRKMEF